MKRVLFDTNIVLDVLLNRPPWVEHATPLWKAVQEERLDGFLTASCLSDIFYIVRKLKGQETARRAVRLCLDTFDICAVGREQLERADSLTGHDFEETSRRPVRSSMGWKRSSPGTSPDSCGVRSRLWTPNKPSLA